MEKITIHITKKRSIVRSKLHSQTILGDVIESVGSTIILNAPTVQRTSSRPSYYPTRQTPSSQYSTRNIQQPKSNQTRQSASTSSGNQTQQTTVRRPSNQEKDTAPARPKKSTTLNRGEPRANRNQ